MVKVPKLPESIEKAIAKAPLLVGLGPSAWPRIINNFYFPKFINLVSNNCQDNEYIRKDGFSVYSVKQVDKYAQITPITPGNIITSKKGKEFLEKIKEPFKFVVYKSMGKFEKICQENGYEFVGNSREIRDKFENKKYFKEVLRKIGVKTIPGENYEIKDLNFKIIEEYKQKYAVKKVVLQIAEATWGGGTGTFFIENEEDYKKYEIRTLELFEKLKDTEKEIKSVNVAPFITGISSSVPCCVTKYGTFVGSIQTQLVDIPEVGAKLETRSGVYSGHDWVVNEFSQNSQKQADEIAKKFGDFIYKEGYKGIFGIDLITDKNGDVWPVECNPRETDAFPLILMLQMEKGAIPFQVFHNLEHLGIDYQIDFEKMDKTYKNKYVASQLLLYNKFTKTAVDRFVIKAGVYKLIADKLEFVREGYASWHLKNEGEFLITEDVNKNTGNVYDPHERILRLIWKGQMVDRDGKVLPTNAKAIDLIYKKLGLIEVETGTEKDGDIDILNVKRIKNAVKHKDIDKVSIVNTFIDQGMGMRRPAKIAWRKDISNGLNFSKKIRYQVNKALKLGVEIKLVDEIDNQTFVKWLNGYKKYLSNKFDSKSKINENWFDEKVNKGKKVGGVFVYKDEKLVGGELFFETGKILGIGYGWGEHMLLMDFKFLEHAKGKGYAKVSFGQDTNLYGGDLSDGLIVYKKKLGFYPVVANKTYWVSTYIKNSKNQKSQNSGEIMFFGSKNRDNNLDTLFVITSDTTKDYTSYLPNGINLEVIDMNEEIKNNAEKFTKIKS